MLYVCNHIPLILALLFLLKKYSLIKSFINVGLIVQAGWVLDLLGKALFNHYIFGSTVYIFNSYSPLGHTVSIALHTSTLIPAFFMTWKTEPEKYTLKVSLAYMAIIYLMSLYLTEPSLDINCVFNMCNVSFLSSYSSPVLFMPLVTLIIILPTHLMQSAVSNWFSGNKKHLFSS